MNRLADETSPYLLQHKDNPVEWWPWGPEALAEAKAKNKPILLSVGYAACHWCHVMAHESFEDEATADVMNKLFVNIKVDREERPDIDAIYMGALHQLGQQGGWPLTMFLDSTAKPFWGGTYFPKIRQWGRPAFVEVLLKIAEVYQNEPQKVADGAAALTSAVAARHGSGGLAAPVTEDMISGLAVRLAKAVDLDHGGLMGAPKFPQWSVLWLLWRSAIRYGDEAAKQAVMVTLRNICQGGIYDHLGGGFARYAVDERWLVPHFEKMLYDNALLIDLLTEVWRETQEPLFKVRVNETVAWLAREMVAEGGGFAASLDADSEGEEGKFYVWTMAEITEVLGAEDAALFAEVYDVTPEGNWEGHTILNRLSELGLSDADDEAKLARLRIKLLERRTDRVRPGWDDKVLADWNGLMIAALARAAVIFERPEWLDLARTAFSSVVDRMSKGPRLWHSYRAGQAKAPGTASDYANMIWAALRLHQADLDPDDLTKALEWTEVLELHHRIDGWGAYATAADDTSDVIVRLSNGRDDAVPNANAVMVSNLAALHALTGETKFIERAEEIVRALSQDCLSNAVVHTGLLAASLDLTGILQIAVTGDDRELAASLLRQTFLVSTPGALLYAPKPNQPDQSLPLGLRGKTASEHITAVYLCTGMHCSAPVSDARSLREKIFSERVAQGTALSKN